MALEISLSVTYLLQLTANPTSQYLNRERTSTHHEQPTNIEFRTKAAIQSCTHRVQSKHLSKGAKLAHDNKQQFTGAGSRVTSEASDRQVGR
jgi:hypothetical protein